ncbi:MAG TPA: nuclease-related domain-containing protein [Verrucomicrobiae bacterium]|jgi:hypothetical protein|nr:nuclease-related domain-containing protein [Verrucomicrobiae bacterium]
MILKSKDSSEETVRRLKLAADNAATDHDRRNVEKQLACVQSGIRGEKEAAYHIDFYLKESSNWVVVHDLRIEWKDRVAQIDHLILSRCLEAYVVESKNYGTKVRHANGGWERLVANHWEGIPCPIEQNERHITVLRQLIENCGLAPKRLGVALPVTFYNVILVAPTCSIVGRFPKNARVYRMDKLTEQISKVEGSPLTLLKVVAPETLRNFGSKLAAWHAPAGAMTPRVRSSPIPTPPAAKPKSAAHLCENCQGGLTPKEAFFCGINKERFAGKSLCRECQKFAPKAQNLQKKLQGCAGCGASVELRVVKYCEDHSARFGNRILCRRCQALNVAA